MVSPYLEWRQRQLAAFAAQTSRLIAFCVYFLTCCPAVLTGQSPTSRPNILFGDRRRLGGRMRGAYGTRWVTTPSFDRIAREGILFRHAYTPMAKCAPSRAIVLTGRHLWQNEEAGNHMAYFPSKLKSWPEVLVEKGWHMGITGKGWGPGVANDAQGKPRQITGKALQRAHKPRGQRKLWPTMITRLTSSISSRRRRAINRGASGTVVKSHIAPTSFNPVSRKAQATNGHRPRARVLA